MQHPFKHPRATHSAYTILGFRTDGRPIHPIAGGSGEGEGGSGGTPPAPPAGDPPAPPTPTPPAPTPPEGGGEPDWKAEARKWEDRAKANQKAQDELEALKAAAMSDQEKAVAEAEKKGRTAAASEYGTKLAGAEFRAAVAAAGIDLGEAAELIDVSRFVADDGEVNVTAIKSAVTKLSKLAPRGAGRSGADMGGAGGSGDQNASLDKQIQEATARRDFATVIRLKRQKAATT
ncbi:hypothetical protein ACFWY6_12620 [Streptomyces sp. NPDC059037]|uniref:hypothetical protein n=1 Tax=Streptomyces sp. NPDC059037 TaxID=3346710 RepID=UPI0036BF96E9